VKHLFEYIFDGVLLLIVIGGGGFLTYHTIRRSEDPALLIFKWIVTIVVVALAIIFVCPMIAQGGYGAAFGGVPATAVVGLALAITWRKNLANLVANPIGNLYDGGDLEYEARPIYSHALALRKRGEHQEALNVVREQLEAFPNDLEGQMLMADIHAENLHNLEAATLVIQDLCNQPNRTAGNVAYALNTLADYHLKLHQDREGARDALRQIIDRFPESEAAMLAAQRIASLSGKEQALAAQERKKYTVAEGLTNIGLIEPSHYQAPAAPDPTKEAAELVAHLQNHPLDGEAREKLANIYADHYHRMDMAADQFEQLITCPNQPQKRVVQWINHLADLQIRHGENYDTVRATLQRIPNLYPSTAAAEVATNRIAILRLELKGKEKVSDVKMGTYDQDIGLKMKNAKPN
jgi:TolA-binding protein